MKSIKLFLCILTLSLSVLGCQSESKQPQKIRVGLSADYPPFESYQKGELVGLDVDIAKAIGEALGLEVEFKEMAFSSLIPAVQAGHIDMAISGLTKNDKRLKRVDFSQNYYVNEFAIITLKETKIEMPLRKIEGKVGAQLGSTMESYAKEHFPSHEVVSLENNMALIEQLKLGRVTAVVCEKAQAKAFVSVNPLLESHELDQTGEGYAVAFKKNSAWQPLVDEALLNLKKTGALETLKQRWIS